MDEDYYRINYNETKSKIINEKFEKFMEDNKELSLDIIYEKLKNYNDYHNKKTTPFFKY